MPELQPFRGLRYVPRASADPSRLLCPPYDVVSDEQRAELAALDEHNAIRLELPHADVGADPYAAAARSLAAWQADGTLMRDNTPLIYVYEQTFAVPGGAQRVARSFFCRLRLEPYGPASGVRPHEHTMSGPKEDRLRLLSAVKANLSPVLMMYDDGAGGATSRALLDELTAAPAALTASGPGGVGQRLWLADPAGSESAAELLRICGARPLTIADGHHRYETALRYSTDSGAPPGAEFVMALLYDSASGGLALLPWHRVISAPQAGRAVIDAARTLFDVEPVASATDMIERFEGTGSEAPAAGVIGVWTGDGGALLTVDRARVAAHVDANQAEAVRGLDVSVLSGTLSEMIGRSSEELVAQHEIAFVSDARDAVARVDRGQASVCFLLAPTPVAAVLDVAAAGEHMPPKSTYFHPKAATGLVFNPLRP